jgi:hypothetical protein
MDLGVDMKDLTVPILMVVCYAVLMSIYSVASNYYPFLKDKKDAVQRAALIISFMAFPLLMIAWGTILGM